MSTEPQDFDAARVERFVGTIHKVISAKKLEIIYAQNIAYFVQ
jgi:hypothetical protein